MARGMRRVPTYYQDLFTIIGTNPGHVIGSTACLGGALPTQLLRIRKLKYNKEVEEASILEEKVDIWIRQMNELFGHGNFFFELQPSASTEQTYVNNQLIRISKEKNIPFIITTDSHYLKKEDAPIHKAFLNSQEGDREVDSFYATTYMMGTEELESYFGDYDREILNTAYKNILKIKNMCEDFSLLKPLKIPELIWKEIPYISTEKKDKYFKLIPELLTFYCSDYNSDKQLVNAIINGIEQHSDLQNQQAYDEINSNLKMTWISSEVNKARWSAYFLNLQKNIEVCWEAGTLVGPGRGSGGGFLLLYVLDIIQLNCLREKTPMFSWRFLNPNRVSVLDIDTDIEGGRRAIVLDKFREVYGEDRVANVATFGTEKSKSAILTAARGLGIDVDVASYISSLIPADRGLLRTLTQCMYGDEENDLPPVKQFVIEMTENYPELWNVAKKIEGLVNRLGTHAGGVIFVDEPFTNSTSLMRSPDGTIITAFDLHDCEDVSLIKIDLLSVEALDKIHICLDLLCDNDFVKRKPTLKQTYESILGVYNLERNNSKMWEMVWNHQIFSLFQMEKESGRNGLAIAKPKSVEELAVLNSVIRLMAPEKGAEQPLNTWARYRNNIQFWYSEMREYGLSEEEIQWLSNHSAITDGMCESQEGLMSLVQEVRLGGNDLTFADSTRKAIAKKQGALFEQCEKDFFKNAKEKGCSNKLVHYVWDVLLKVQRGYSFCRAHCHAYSLIALQEMNLAFRFPIIFWNCACLISDSGGVEISANDENLEENEVSYANEEIYYNEMEEFGANDSEDDIEDSYEEEDCDGYPAEVVVLKDGKKKKKLKTTNYGRIATAIGKMRMEGITVAPPDINKSTYTFSPDVTNNTIRYGLSGINKIGEDLVRSILINRPYSSIEDLTSKVKITKPQVVNLIKSGAFDFLGNRYEVMQEYIISISDQKKRVTLQNMKMLIDFELLPEELDFECKVYNFNKYLKKLKLDSFYGLDTIAFEFYEENFDFDLLTPTDETESGFKIKQLSWDRIYQSYMDKVRPYVKTHQKELLTSINNRLMSDMWNKYCLGSISKWEMDSVSYYSHKHELDAVNEREYGFKDFFKLPEEPEIETIINIKGKQIPLFKINRIIGTVLDRDKAKKTVTLLTKNGVVTIKIFGQVFSHYDKQLSKRGADGKKHITERSWLSRGNKIIVTGIRRENDFIAKKYQRTPYHLVELITEIDENGKIKTSGERKEEE